MMEPWFTTLPLPGPDSVRTPLSIAASLTARVEAVMPPTSTCAPLPNSTPLGLISQTCPLASR